MKKIAFNVDSRWDNFSIPYTKEVFEEITDKLIFSSEGVPEIINQKLNQVKSVYNLRSIDYELQDVACFLMIMTLELALRTKFELDTKANSRKGLAGLLYWARKKKYLDINSKQIDAVVKIRNSFAHIKRPEDVHGVTASYIIHPINNWINELYK